MHVQAQARQAEEQFLAKVIVIINQINEGRDCHTILCPPFDRRRDPMQFFRIRLHLIIALSIMLGCFSTQAWARTLKPTDGVEAPVSLDRKSTRLNSSH